MSLWNALLAPMMVWTWGLTFPGLTIGSILASMIGFPHGKRQKAFALEARRNAAVDKEPSMEGIMVKECRCG